MSLLSSRAEEREVLESRNARVLIYRVGPSVLVTQVTGYGAAALVERLIARSDELIARVGTISVVHDWFGVTGYDSSVRGRMTPWALKTRNQHRAIHIGTTSALVQMGVSMVRLAAGAPVHAHKTIEALEDALVEAVRGHAERP